MRNHTCAIDAGWQFAQEKSQLGLSRLFSLDPKMSSVSGAISQKVLIKKLISRQESKKEYTFRKILAITIISGRSMKFQKE